MDLKKIVVCVGDGSYLCEVWKYALIHKAEFTSLIKDCLAYFHERFHLISSKSRYSDCDVDKAMELTSTVLFL